MLTMLRRLRGLLFENRGTRQTIVKNVFWLGFGQVASRFIRAAIIIYAARVLGAAEYGVFSYALGLAGFFTIFADVGVNSILTREATQKPGLRSHFFATSFWIKSFLLAGTAIAVIFIAPHFSKIEAAKALIPFVAFLTIFDGIREFSNSFLRALERMELEAFITILTNVAITIAGFVILSFSVSAQALTFSYVASTATGALAAVIILRGEYRKIFSSFKRDLVRPVLRSALPIAFISLFGAFMLNTDMIMLGWWRTAEELGFYSAAQKVLQVLYTFPGILAAALFPTISRLIGQKRSEETRTLTEQSMTTLFLASMPITVGGIVLAGPIMEFLYGAAYAPATIPFRLLMVTIMLTFPGAPLSNLVIAYDKQRAVLLPLIGGSLANVVFDILLIPPFGMAGSAVATIIAQLVSIGFVWRIVKRMNDFRTIRHLPKILIATVVMGAAAFALNLAGVHVIVTIVASALIYFGMLAALKEPLLRELGGIWNSLRGQRVTPSSTE